MVILNFTRLHRSLCRWCSPESSFASLEQFSPACSDDVLDAYTCNTLGRLPAWIVWSLLHNCKIQYNKLYNIFVCTCYKNTLVQHLIQQNLHATLVSCGGQPSFWWTCTVRISAAGMRHILTALFHVTFLKIETVWCKFTVHGWILLEKRWKMRYYITFYKNVNFFTFFTFLEIF